MTKDILKIRKAREVLKNGTEADKEKVRQELEAIAGSEVTDTISWDDKGKVELLNSNDLSIRARKGIKKVKATPGKYGTSIEIEMHDKLGALRLLAKHHGLLDDVAEDKRPSVIGINITGPNMKDVKIEEE
ncbi:terminase small subunit [Polaribacter sp.]|uniref:terminase small subunit n=1 Tax=Polaribacter sp. TaxID=1920175 RepID=UPI0025FA67C8|nr:terminase small subunit [Polaribacter sp.]|tara:strand:+ start:1538 stop:1930 length:393 start_codon:yes stop_codon:yes gene_type:complete